MKRKILLFSLMVMVLLVTSPALAEFINGNFESGDFTGWTQGAGRWTGGPMPTPTDYLPSGSKYNMTYNKSAVVSPGLDPRTGNQLNMVYNGNYSVRVNDYSNNYHVSVISQTVKGWTDSHIYFAWAAVLEQSHGATDSDNFTLKLTDDTLGTTLYEVQYNSFNNGPIFTKTGNWYWTEWQVEDLDTTANIGHDLTLTLLGSDCPHGGHGGYVYLDGFGAVIPPVVIPVPPTLILLGSSLAGLVAYRRMRLTR
jgi:hypothetical protein